MSRRHERLFSIIAGITVIAALVVAAVLTFACTPQANQTDRTKEPIHGI